MNKLKNQALSILIICLGGFFIISFPAWGIDNFIKSKSFIQLVAGIANYLFKLVIPIGIIALIWSGILFLAAEGNEQKIIKAKRSLTWTIIGLSIAIIGGGFVTLIQDITQGATTAEGVVNAFKRLASFMFIVGPAIVVIFLTWAGITYMLAGGDERKIEEAKKRFYWGIVGAAIIIGAGAIINTLIAAFK